MFDRHDVTRPRLSSASNNRARQLANRNHSITAHVNSHPQRSGKGKRTIEGKYLSSSEKILGSLVFTRMSVHEDDTESERYYCDARSERKRGSRPHRPDARAAQYRRISGIPGVLRLCRRTTWGQWFPAAGLARTSGRLPRALLSATVLPLLVIAAALVTESHAVLVAAPLGRLRSGTDCCRRHQLAGRNFCPATCITRTMDSS